MFSNILLPYDGSSFAEHAFNVALDVARKYNSKICLLSCIDKIAFRGWYTDSSYDNILIKKQTKAIKERLAVLENKAKNVNIQSSSHILVTTSIVKEIVSFAKSHKIDLIIMGSHGRRGLDKFLLGSVTNGVSQRAHCPVLIVR
jgi:nucleotide-binding universal stress UspA family protein